jgi:hypothetical protein
MKLAGIIALSATAFVTLVPTLVSADTYWDVEAARANARAGGPTNAFDADLLERYGCLSGTRSAFCQRQARGERPYYRSYRKPRRSAR